MFIASVISLLHIFEFIRLMPSRDLYAYTQEQLKQAVKNVVDLIKEPFYALRDAISKVIKTVKMIVKKIKRTLLAIKRLVLSIRKSMFSPWLR